MSDQAISQKSGRSKSGCQTCRARKVRCDERTGVCLNCERLGLPCAPSTEQNPTPPRRPEVASTSGFKRKRTFRSCAGCRASKTRCSGDKPICVRCRERDLSCDYEDDSEPAWRQQLRLTAAVASPSRQASAGAVSDETPLGSNEILLGRSIGHFNGHEATSYHTQEDSWGLWSPNLPDIDKTRALAEYYFVNVHPLRCFGFLHKPSFMRRLDSGDTNRDDDPLLHIVCALGALFLAVENEPRVRTPAHTIAAGSQWAKKAQHLILTQLGNIAVENLMAATLLHDYEMRMGNFGTVFMLSALTARMAQALQINLEHSTDILCREPGNSPDASTKESRRRLMWCCYISDSLVGSGVDQLTLIRDTDIKIQLPCNERNFLLQTACVTEVLEPGQFLKFLEPNLLPSNPGDNMGIRAYFVRYIATRRKVLRWVQSRLLTLLYLRLFFIRYIKRLDTAMLPWLPESEFAQLDGESRAWYSSLPPSLQFTPTAMYIRKETSQLGALFSLHYMYHLTMCDLYRISAPRLYKLRHAFDFPPEQIRFLTHLQAELFVHARSVASITAEAARHGPHALADSWIPTITYDACRGMLFYLTQIMDPAAEQTRLLMSETIPLVQTSIKALRYMQSMYSIAELLANAAEKMLEKVSVGPEGTPAGHSIVPDEPYPSAETDGVESSAPGTPVQSAPDYVLNPLSIYRMARKAIPEKHAPEKQPNATSPSTSSASRSTLQRRATLQHVPLEGVPESHVQSTATQVDTSWAAGEQSGFDDLLSLFTSDPSGWTWQPSDTAMGSQNESNGLPPWEPTYVDQQLDAWMPMFSAQTQPYGF